MYAYQLGWSPLSHYPASLHVAPSTLMHCDYFPRYLILIHSHGTLGAEKLPNLDIFFFLCHFLSRIHFLESGELVNFNAFPGYIDPCTKLSITPASISRHSSRPHLYISLWAFLSVVPSRCFVPCLLMLILTLVGWRIWNESVLRMNEHLHTSLDADQMRTGPLPVPCIPGFSVSNSPHRSLFRALLPHFNAIS